MTRIIVDSSTLARLGDLSGPAELWDESGRVLGYFTPATGSSAHECPEPLVSEEELDRRQGEGGGRPLAHILADLDKRA